MRVGFLVSSVSREAGGLFQSVRGLARAVMSEDVNASAFGISDPNSALDVLNWQPASVRTFETQFRAWGYSNQLVPALVAADLDILSTHGLWKYCSVASRRWHGRTARPYIVHPHGMLEPWALQNAGLKKRIAALLYENQHLRGAACFRALCEPEAQSIRAYGMRNPICVIPNGVDLPTRFQDSGFGVQDSELMRFAGGRKVLLYLGRLHPKKNLAKAGYERELKKLTSDYGLSASIRFLGPLFGQNKDAAFHACDAFVLPSLSEGLPMTVLEAWAHAKPVLMTPECNLPEGFAAGAALQIGTALEEIATGLRQLTEMSDDDRTAMGERGRTLVSTKFSWPQIGEQMRCVYEWVLGGGATPQTVRL
ncbi:MAG: glycosyl transferase family 1 [Verrucomicrobia bacterium]|nr:MAG: glycosyl transferase family 1 [Verrucomicrobiota bacterium]